MIDGRALVKQEMRSTIVFTFVSLSLFCGVALAQKGKAVVPQASPSPTAGPAENVRSSPAFAEILLRRTEFEAEVESLILEYTDEFPKVKELRQGILMLNRESDRLFKVKPEKAESLTLALGKLMVRKVEAEVDLWRLQQSYADGHPDVKRARRKLEIFEKAIREILG